MKNNKSEQIIANRERRQKRLAEDGKMLESVLPVFAELKAENKGKNNNLEESDEKQLRINIENYALEFFSDNEIKNARIKALEKELTEKDQLIAGLKNTLAAIKNLVIQN